MYWNIFAFRILSLYAHDFTEYTRIPNTGSLLSEIFGVTYISEFRIKKI